MSSERIALFLPTLQYGGVERVMLNLAGGFAGRGFPVDLLVADPRGEFRSQVPPEVRLVDLGGKRVLASLSALVRYLRRERPAGLLAAMDHTNVVALWARKLAGVPTRIVASSHCLLSREARAGKLWRSRLMPFFARHFYPWADEVVAVSQGVAGDLARVTGLSRERIQVIYNPVVTPHLLAQAQAPLEHPWFQASSPPVVLAVGRLSIEKDHVTLIRAFSLVRRQRTARLLILGEGKERRALQGLVASLGLGEDVALPGFVENPLAYMARSAVFALSSSFEGFGLVLVEALAAGVPVVSTDCESGPREILEDGELGRLVPGGDPEALARAILQSLDQPRHAPSAKSLQRYSLPAALDSYGHLLTPQAKHA